MANVDLAVLSRALQGVADGTSVTAPESDREILTASIEGTLYELAAIAPTTVVLARSCASIRRSHATGETTDRSLLDDWERHIRIAIASFSTHPESFTCEDSTEFMSRAAVVFGVDDDLMPKLILEYHGLPRPTRLGVLRMIERSSVFSYVSRMATAMDDPADDPDLAFRRLIQVVFEAR
ncbi:MAG: hypothetical protein AAGI22_28830 [Planctomycetota bacterium]